MPFDLQSSVLFYSDKLRESVECVRVQRIATWYVLKGKLAMTADLKAYVADPGDLHSKPVAENNPKTTVILTSSCLGGADVVAVVNALATRGLPVVQAQVAAQVASRGDEVAFHLSNLDDVQALEADLNAAGYSMRVA